MHCACGNDVSCEHGRCPMDCPACDRETALEDALEALKVTAGNIRSLGPAGALAPVPYREWLKIVEKGIDSVTGHRQTISTGQEHHGESK